jgi:hypothetical protein
MTLYFYIIIYFLHNYQEISFMLISINIFNKIQLNFYKI